MGRGKHIYRAEKDGVNLYEGTMQEITNHFMCSDNVVYRSVSGGRLYKGIRFTQTEQRLPPKKWRSRITLLHEKARLEVEREEKRSDYDKLVYRLKLGGKGIAYVSFNPCKYLPDLLEKEGLNCCYHHPKFTKKAYKGHKPPKEEWIVEVCESC